MDIIGLFIFTELIEEFRIADLHGIGIFHKNKKKSYSVSPRLVGNTCYDFTQDKTIWF